MQPHAVRLTWVEIHGRLFMMSFIGGLMVPVAFPIIIDGKYSKQDDGDNLQSQGHDGELQPHVGSVCRHPENNTAYLSQSDTHTHPICLSGPLGGLFFERLCCVKGGKKVASGFKLMLVLQQPMTGQMTGAWVVNTPTPLTSCTHGDGFPIGIRGEKPNTNVMTFRQWVDMGELLNDCSFLLIILCQSSVCWLNGQPDAFLLCLTLEEKKRYPYKDIAAV